MDIESWSPGSWRGQRKIQHPDWSALGGLEQTQKALSGLPPLILAGEARRLRDALGNAALGRAFLLQVGHYGESSTDWSANAIRDQLKIISQMAAVLAYGSGVPVVKVASMPGARRPDPECSLAAYYQSASTLNLLRAFTAGGFASLSRAHSWNREFAASPVGRRHRSIVHEMDWALRLMSACGIDLSTEPSLRQAQLWTSHEALLLPWEEGLTRRDSATRGWFDCSAHLLWVDERSSHPDGAHVEFLRGVRNPVAAKLGPTITAAELVALCGALNPDRVPGRLTLICQMGAERVVSVLPPLLMAARAAGQPAVWVCDPIHGNRPRSGEQDEGQRLDDLLAEIRGFLAAHADAGTWPGGVYLPLTGYHPMDRPDRAALDRTRRFTKVDDPGLSPGQALELAFRLAELLREL